MPKAFEAIALKTRWSPFLKSLLPLVLSRLKTGVLPKSKPRMVYLLKVGATEPGKLNIASFSASRSFNYIESLSGIETKTGSTANGLGTLSTTLNPYQGLKQQFFSRSLSQDSLSTTLNPYQGLKLKLTKMNDEGNPAFNYIESLSGIETMQLNSRTRLLLWRLSTTLNPYQGLKPSIWGCTSTR